MSNRISQLVDVDELAARYSDHTEVVYLGQWVELTIGRVRLVRREDGMVEVTEVEEEW